MDLPVIETRLAQIDFEIRGLRQAALNQSFGKRILNELLERTAERTRPVIAVAAGLLENVLRGIHVEADGDLLRLQILVDAGDEKVDDLQKIVTRSASILNAPIDADGSRRIAQRSRGTPRIANRLLRRVRDYAQVKGDGSINEQVAEAALNMLQVDPLGFDTLDRKFLMTIIERFDGGPVGIDSIAAAIGEERGTLEDVVEPFLIQQGFVVRTSRGRIVTRATYLHFGLKTPERIAANLQLFEDDK